MIRYTLVRIVRDNNVEKSFDTRNEPSMYNDLMEAVTGNLIYNGCDLITKATCYLYDNVKHWIIELTSLEDEE